MTEKQTPLYNSTKTAAYLPSPARGQGCSPVPLSCSGSAGTPGSSQYGTSDTHAAVLGEASAPVSAPASWALTWPHCPTAKPRCARLFRHCVIFPLPRSHPPSPREIPRQVLIPQQLVEPLPCPAAPGHPLPVPGAHSRCRALPSAVSPLSLSHSPSFCATSPRDVSAARPPQPPQRTLHATQPPIASRCCCCFPAQRCHSDRRGIPSSGPPPPRASLGITHCSSS